MIVKHDEMTPRERMVAFFAGKEYDRLPCCPSLGETCAPLLGVKICDYYNSTDKMVMVETEVFRKFRPDSAGIGLGLRGIPDAMGAKIGYPDYGIAYISEPLVNDYSDIDNLNIINPLKDGCLPAIIEANQRIRNAIGSEVSVGAGIAGPFTVAAAIRGTENFLKDIYINPSAVHKLLEIVTENCLRYIDTVCSMGFSSGVGDPVASGSVISLKHFREFAKPYIKLCHERIKKLTGSGGRLHICGRTKDFWDDMIDCGAGILSIDNIEDMGEASSAVGEKTCLMGNVDPVKVIKEGTVNDVFSDVKECIKKAGDNPGGFIVSSGCQVPAGSPAENIQAMMDATRIYGQYKYRGGIQ